MSSASKLPAQECGLNLLLDSYESYFNLLYQDHQNDYIDRIVITGYI